MTTGSRTPRRWGFRTRLAALIAGVFILAGASLLTVQYAVVHQLLRSGIANLATAPSSNFPTPHSRCPGDQDSTQCGILAGTPSGVVASNTGPLDATFQRTILLSREVLSGLLLWSVVVLVAFAGVAALAGWWLSKRSLGRIAQITATARDLTRDDLHRRLDLPSPDDEIKELGDTIDSMLDRLDDAFTRQELFIASASHELRTPLTTARTALEIPLVQGRVPTELEPDLRRALKANERSERLIAALLILARLTHPATPPADTTVDVTELVRERIKEHGDHARRRCIQITFTTAEPMLAAAEPVLAGIAIGNLIDNAIQHGAHGGEIVVDLDREDGMLTLRIANGGLQLTADEATRLVEPFNRGAATRLAGRGIGLGLTIVDAIARCSAGTLALSPRTEGGLIAELKLSAA